MLGICCRAPITVDDVYSWCGGWRSGELGAAGSRHRRRDALQGNVRYYGSCKVNAVRTCISERKSCFHSITPDVSPRRWLNCILGERNSRLKSNCDGVGFAVGIVNCNSGNVCFWIMHGKFFSRTADEVVCALCY